MSPDSIPIGGQGPFRGSIVIPALNEARSIPVLWQELNRVIATLPGTWEVLFIDDGSTDGTTDVLRRICKEDNRARLIRFARNLGKSAAYHAAFRAARGEFIVTLDADLQDDPREIPRLLHELEGTDHDLIVGWKQGRTRNEPMKTIPSFFYNGLKRRLFGLHLHDSNCGMRVMHRSVAESMDLYGDHHRFIPEMAALAGFSVGEMPIRHRRRRYGESKFGAMRFWTGMLDMLSIRFLMFYSSRPLHFFGYISLAFLFLGATLEAYVLMQKILFESTLRTHIAAMIVGVLMIVVGVQMLATGLVCEFMLASRRRERGLIKETIGIRIREKQPDA